MRSDLEFEDSFDGQALHMDRWLPHYLPHWSSRDRSAARYQMGGDGVRLLIDAREFHVYAVDWTPNDVTFFVDDSRIKIVDQSPAYPMQLMLSIYAFPPTEPSDSPGRYPKAFIVDYVRGYRLPR
jgi:hypothetical protein